jgi:hypothetical protein
MHRYTTRQEDDLRLPSAPGVAVSDLSTRVDVLADKVSDMGHRASVVDQRIDQLASKVGILISVLAGMALMLGGIIAGLWWVTASL